MKAAVRPASGAVRSSSSVRELLAARRRRRRRRWRRWPWTSGALRKPSGTCMRAPPGGGCGHLVAQSSQTSGSGMALPGTAASHGAPRLGSPHEPPRLEPGDTGPRLHPRRRRRPPRRACKDFRAERVVALRLPGGHDPGLHQAGLRLPRLPRLARRRPASPCWASRPTSPRSSRSSASATASRSRCCPTRTRRCSTAYGAYGEKKLYGKTVVGVIRSTFVDRRPRAASSVAQYNVKATGHVAKLRRDLGLG